MEVKTRGWSALIVGDLGEPRSILGDQLARVGFDLAYAGDGSVALSVVERCVPDLILTGRRLAGLDGIGFIRRVREFSNVPVIMIAAQASVSDCEESMRAGTDRYLELERDLDRVASVACELVGLRPSALGLAPHRSITASEARSHAKRELARELQALLVECRGNIAAMARRMGKDRSTIRYHLRRLGMLDEANPIGIASDADDPVRLSSELSRRAG